MLSIKCVARDQSFFEYLVSVDDKHDNGQQKSVSSTGHTPQDIIIITWGVHGLLQFLIAIVANRMNVPLFLLIDYFDNIGSLLFHLVTNKCC